MFGETMVNTSSSSWLQEFVHEKPFDSLVAAVPKEYIEDRFNLTDLPHKNQTIVLQAIELIKGNAHSSSSDDSDVHTRIREHCVEVYGLIHARYILTPPGIAKMDSKIHTSNYGLCQRVYCNEYNLMPVGLYNTPGEDKMYLYCAKCNEIYKLTSKRHQKVDGCFFGISFPMMYFMMNPRKRPKVDDRIFKVISPETENWEKCLCDVHGFSSGSAFKVLFPRIGPNDLVYNPSLHGGLNDWVVSLAGNKILVLVPQEFMVTQRAKVEQLVLFKDSTDQSEILELLAIFTGETVVRENLKFDKNLFYLFIKIYGAFHSLYVMTHEGLEKIKTHWQNAVFGVCPRQKCIEHTNHLFPVTLCSQSEHSLVKYYCFSCQGIYHLRINKTRNFLDGTFYNIFLLYQFMLKYPELLPNSFPEKFVPKLFGFEIHPDIFKRGQIKLESLTE